MELQDPDSILSSPPLDDDSSIVTVQSNPEKLFLVDADNDEIDHITESQTHHTIVEVVNPIILGDGNPNEIVTSRGIDTLEEEFYGSNPDIQSLERETCRKKPELSLNAKMKNVLQELVENERVKLRLSQSIDEDDEEEDEDDDDDDEEEDDDDYDENLDKNQTTSFYDSYYDNLNAGSFVVDGCQVYQNPNTESILNTTIGAEENEEGETFLSSNSSKLEEEKETVDEMVACSLPLDCTTKESTVEDVVEEEGEDETTNGLTGNDDALLEQQQQMSSSNKSGISNNKRKKRKNRNKRK